MQLENTLAVTLVTFIILGKPPGHRDRPYHKTYVATESPPPVATFHKPPLFGAVISPTARGHGRTLPGEVGEVIDVIPIWSCLSFCL